MYISECLVCIGLALGVASCSFGLCIVLLLLQEGCRQLRSFVDRTISSSCQLASPPLILRPVPATVGRLSLRGAYRFRARGDELPPGLKG